MKASLHGRAAGEWVIVEHAYLPEGQGVKCDAYARTVVADPHVERLFYIYELPETLDKMAIVYERVTGTLSAYLQ